MNELHWIVEGKWPDAFDEKYEKFKYYIPNKNQTVDKSVHKIFFLKLFNVCGRMLGIKNNMFDI